MKALNIFPNHQSSILHDQALSIRIGRILSIAWAVCFIVVVIAVVVYYSTANAIVSDLQNPKLSDIERLRLLGYNPICSCSNSAPDSASFITFDYELEPVCGLIEPLSCSKVAAYVNTLYYYTENSQLNTDGVSNYMPYYHAVSSSSSGAGNGTRKRRSLQEDGGGVKVDYTPLFTMNTLPDEQAMGNCKIEKTTCDSSKK